MTEPRRFSWRAALLSAAEQLFGLAERLRMIAGAPPSDYVPLAATVRRKALPPVLRDTGIELEVELPPEDIVELPPPVQAELPSPAQLLARLREPASVREAFVLKEVLERPRALRRRVL